MQKIPTLFVRDETNMSRVTREVTEGCEWVLAGEGVATRKWDGTACLIHGGAFYKRLEWSASRGPAPAQWLHHSFDPAQRSGHGWFPVGDGPEDWMHRSVSVEGLPDGTYELCGPKVGRNPEKMEVYELIPHGELRVTDPAGPRTLESIRDMLMGYNAEGIVWHHPDGRMVKIKARDFGIRWPR